MIIIIAVVIGAIFYSYILGKIHGREEKDEK